MFEKIMVANFSIFDGNINLKIQEAQWSSSRINTGKTTNYTNEYWRKSIKSWPGKQGHRYKKITDVSSKKIQAKRE